MTDIGAESGARRTGRKRNDIILAAALILASLLILLLTRAFSQEGAVAVVSQDGSVIMRIPLSESSEQIVESQNGGYNKIVVSDGKVSVTEASCPDGICVSHRAINRTGESIICLPNRLSVYVLKGEDGIDAYT